MFQLSVKSKYGLAAVIELAQQKKRAYSNKAISVIETSHRTT